jgi:ribosomal protein S8
MKSIREFLNKVHIGYKCRSVFIKVRLNVENSKIVHYFYEKGWIKIYSVKNNEIYVYLRYVNNKPLFTKIRFISTSGHRKYFTNKGVILFRKHLGGSARILMHTSCGLLGSKFAENLGIGGEISYLLYE